MDSFDFNKIAMAILGTVFLVMSLMFLSDAIFHPVVPETQGYAIEVADGGGSSGEAADTGPAYEPITALLASADAAAGEKVAKKCVSCHTFEEGGAKKVGPNLYDIVNKPIASNGDFAYSAALKTYGEGKNWTYEELNGFMWNPKKFIKGTAMGFPGLKKVDDRANIIAYLRSFAATPAPLPEATGETGEAGDTASESESSAASSESENNTEESSDDATQSEGTVEGSGDDATQDNN